MRHIGACVLGLVLMCGGVEGGGGISVFWEGAKGWYLLDEGAYRFVGLPFVNTGAVTVVVVDGWSDGHGQTVEAIIVRGAPGVRIVRVDVDPAIYECENELDFIKCAQEAFAEAVEDAAEIARSGPTVVNMSFGLFFRASGMWERLVDEKGCENSWKLNVESLKRIRDAIQGSQAVWVASAGNQGRVGVGFPACLSPVYAVMSLERREEYDVEDLEIAWYSNRLRAERVFAEPIGGVMLGPGGIVFQGTSFSAPLFSALMANALAVCGREPSRLQPAFMTKEGFPVLTVLGIREC